MLIPVTTTSRTLEQMLSAVDYGILRGKYTTLGGGIIKNRGGTIVYIETGKTATSTDSWDLNPDEIISVGFLGDIFQTQFKTTAGTNNLVMLF